MAICGSMVQVKGSQGRTYGPAVDLWACGIILFILLSGQPPFYHREKNLLYRKIAGGQYAFQDPIWDVVSEECAHAITLHTSCTQPARLIDVCMLRVDLHFYLHSQSLCDLVAQNLSIAIPISLVSLSDVQLVGNLCTPSAPVEIAPLMCLLFRHRIL
jgi:serine/threonine protein kinase